MVMDGATVLTRRLVEMQEEDRRHLARDLHDEIGQVLCAVSVNLKALIDVGDAAARPRLEESIRIVDDAIGQVRNLALELRPEMLDELGLVPTLRWYADRQAQRAGFILHFHADWTRPRLPADLETACYRIVQEALTNVARHAQARHVWLELHEERRQLRLVVRDDGIGFDAAAQQFRAAREAGLGVRGMRERVELLGGKIEMESRPGWGTNIEAHLPLAPQE
jgi:signal transduction histidine kinase